MLRWNPLAPNIRFQYRCSRVVSGDYHSLAKHIHWGVFFGFGVVSPKNQCDGVLFLERTMMIMIKFYTESSNSFSLLLEDFYIIHNLNVLRCIIVRCRIIISRTHRLGFGWGFTRVYDWCWVFTTITRSVQFHFRAVRRRVIIKHHHEHSKGGHCYHDPTKLPLL